MHVRYVYIHRISSLSRKQATCRKDTGLLNDLKRSPQHFCCCPPKPVHNTLMDEDALPEMDSQTAVRREKKEDLKGVARRCKSTRD